MDRVRRNAGDDCGIITAMAAESKMGSDPETTAWREPAATLVWAICVTVTAVAAKALDMLTEHFWVCAEYHPPYTGEHMTMRTYVSPTTRCLKNKD